MTIQARNKINDELAAISQKLRVIVNEVQETDDIDILAAFPDLAEAKNRLNDAKYIINQDNVMKKIRKESKSELKQHKSFGQRRTHKTE